jgi:threonine synthase
MSLNHYIYRCYSCTKEYDSGQIEGQLHYLCPDCGQAEDNQPLTGILNVIYDLNSLKKELSRKDFLDLPPGRPWMYPVLWPLDYRALTLNKNILQRLALPANLVIPVEHEDNEILVLDDTRNPTYSYKDRASILVALKAMQSGYTNLSVASTGNAGSSLAGICARLNLNSHIWVPDRIPKQKLLQIQSYAANIYIVDGSYDMAFDLNLKISKKQNWYNRNTAYNPLTIEGKKSGAYDIFISTKGNIPDNIIVPVGDGAIIGGIYKGFTELLELGWIEQLPKIFAAQAAGSDALVRYTQSRQFEFKEAKTLADSLCAGAPRNLYMAADAVIKSNGQAVAMSDQEILDAQKFCAENWGFLVEPSAAVTLAAYQIIISKRLINKNTKTLLMFTGSGLKDIGSIERWSDNPEIKTVDQWNEIFDLNESS